MEFVPRNMSAPNLSLMSGQMGMGGGIRDFVPSNGGMFQSPQAGTMQGMGEQDIMLEGRMNI